MYGLPYFTKSLRQLYFAILTGRSLRAADSHFLPRKWYVPFPGKEIGVDCTQAGSDAG